MPPSHFRSRLYSVALDGTETLLFTDDIHDLNEAENSEQAQLDFFAEEFQPGLHVIRLSSPVSVPQPATVLNSALPTGAAVYHAPIEQE